MAEKLIHGETSHKGLVYIRDVAVALEVNKSEDFVPPGMEQYLTGLQLSSGKNLSNLILLSRNALFFLSGKRHILLRKKIMNTLGKGNIQKWVPIFDEAITAAVLKLKHSSEPDIISDFTYPIFRETTQRILGIEPVDPLTFDFLSQTLQTLLQPLLPLRELIKMENVLGDLLDQVRNSRTVHNDEGLRTLLQELISFKAEDFSKEDAFATILVLYGAAINISQTMANIIWHILSAPASVKKSAKNPFWFKNNLEYFIKIGASPRYIHSISIKDTEIKGVTFYKKDNVLIDLLEIHGVGCPFSKQKTWDEEELSNDAHIAFGKGAHFCVGAYMSRVLIERAIPQLFENFPEMDKLIVTPEIGSNKQTVFLKTLKVAI